MPYSSAGLRAASRPLRFLGSFSGIAAVTLLLAGAGCSKTPAPGAAASAADALPPARVQVVTVREATIPSFIEVTGSVRPVERATLAAKLMGVIEEIPVTVGQRFAAGDVLVKISAGEISARFTQAQVQLNQAQRELAREKDLLTKNASTAEVVRNLEDRVALMQATVREAEVMLGHATVRAPFAGVVSAKPANTGDLATPGQPLLEIEGAGGFQVEAGIPDSLAVGIAVGASLTVSIPATAAAFSARVVELSPVSDTRARTLPIKLAIPAGTAARSGQFARVQVPGATLRALLVPATAVSLLGQMERVWIAGEGNRAVLRLVKTGAVHGDQREILSGLTDGERVVVAPPGTLREGQALEVRP